MLIRLQGLVLIINTLIPAALLLAAAGLFLFFKSDVETAWTQDVRPQLTAIEKSAEQSIGLVEDAVSNASTKISSAAKGLDKVSKGFDAVGDAVAPTLKKLNGISVPTFKVGWRHEKFCGPKKFKCVPSVTPSNWAFGKEIAKPFNAAFGAMASAAKPLADMKDAIAELGVIEDISGEAAKAQKALGRLAATVLSLAKPIGTLFTAIGYIVIFLVVWFGFQYAVRGANHLRNGFRMLITGQANRPTAVAEG